MKLVVGIIASVLVVLGQPERGCWIEYQDRLAGLTPDAPRGYLHLAEEIASEARSEADRDLARRLYVLAHELGRSIRGQAEADVAAIACVGLAEPSLGLDRATRQWLIALAGMHDARYGEVALVDERAGQGVADVDACLALAAIRRGDRAEAEKLLADEGVRRSIARGGELIGMDDALGVVLEQAENARCAACGGDRLVLDPQTRERVICEACGGRGARVLGEEERREHLRLEGALVGAGADSWASQLVLRGEASLPRIDASSLAGVVGVDPTGVYWIGEEAGEGDPALWSATPRDE